MPNSILPQAKGIYTSCHEPKSITMVGGTIVARYGCCEQLGSASHVNLYLSLLLDALVDKQPCTSNTAFSSIGIFLKPN